MSCRKLHSISLVYIPTNWALSLGMTVSTRKSWASLPASVTRSFLKLIFLSDRCGELSKHVKKSHVICKSMLFLISRQFDYTAVAQMHLLRVLFTDKMKEFRYSLKKRKSEWLLDTKKFYFRIRSTRHITTLGNNEKSIARVRDWVVGKGLYCSTSSPTWINGKTTWTIVD